MIKKIITDEQFAELMQLTTVDHKTNMGLVTVFQLRDLDSDKPVDYTLVHSCEADNHLLLTY